jgi:hypothetical protein
MESLDNTHRSAVAVGRGAAPQPSPDSPSALLETVQVIRTPSRYLGVVWARRSIFVPSERRVGGEVVTLHAGMSSQWEQVDRPTDPLSAQCHPFPAPRSPFPFGEVPIRRDAASAARKREKWQRCYCAQTQSRHTSGTCAIVLPYG